jgi:serine/threonine-protein kinase RIO1
MAKKAKKSNKSQTSKTKKKAGKKSVGASSRKKSGAKKKSQRATSQPWKEKEVERLKKLIMQNTPTPLIASKLKRSLVSVRGYVQRNGLSLRPTNRNPSD